MGEYQSDTKKFEMEALKEQEDKLRQIDREASTQEQERQR